MPNLDFLKSTFDELAQEGHIGDPNGTPAYAYLRVSSSEQAEEGRSGLPRQLEHIHEVARKKGYKISWELLFADDFTGFEFAGRPGLTKLRQEFKASQPRAQAIIMEDIDRLSRNADWHQGFLRHEMHSHDIAEVYWKEIPSRIERAVRGAIAQDGMEQARERMKAGTLKKAESGRITAKVAAFGYRFTDSAGNENTMEARRDTRYSINEEQAVAVRFIFDQLAYHGLTCYELCIQLDERAKIDPRFRPPRAYAWNERTLVKLIRNSLYKGDFIANRHYIERVIEADEHGFSSKTVMKSRQRPEDEWIRVPVPAIVDPDTWDLANRNLYRNKQFSQRNKKNEYMFTSLVRCATCGRRYIGNTENKPKRTRRYYCSTMLETPAYRENRPCGQKTIHCDLLENAVWEAITEALLNPDILLQAIDARYSNTHVDDIREQILFLGREIHGKADEERKLYAAYLAGAFTAEEYAAERKRAVREREGLQVEIQILQSQILTPEELVQKKKATIELVEKAVQSINTQDAPFSLKRQIVRLLVDEIVLNVKEEWFEIYGTLGGGRFSLPGDAVVRTPSL